MFKPNEFAQHLAELIQARSDADVHARIGGKDAANQIKHAHARYDAALLAIEEDVKPLAVEAATAELHAGVVPGDMLARLEALEAWKADADAKAKRTQSYGAER